MMVVWVVKMQFMEALGISELQVPDMSFPVMLWIEVDQDAVFRYPDE